MSSTALGLIAVLGIWVANGIALPLVAHFKKEFAPEQLMTTRGVATAILAAMLLGDTLTLSVEMLLLGVFFSVACLGLYRGIQAWGANLTIVVVTTTPVVNFLIAMVRGREGNLVPEVISLVLIIAGVVTVLFGGVESSSPEGSGTRRRQILVGFGWSVLGVIMNALYYETLAITPDVPWAERCFWQAVILAIIGLVGSWHRSWTPLYLSTQRFLLVVGFSLLAGFVYFVANIVAFDNLPVTTASVLAQGETPAVIVMAALLVGERLTAKQWFGVVITLAGATYLSLTI